MKFRMIKITALLLFMVLFFSSCGEGQKVSEEKHGEEATHEEEESHAEVVKLSDAELKEFDIKLSTAGPGFLKTDVSLPGEVIIPPDNIAHIHPRFAGIVKKVYKHIGDKVNKGDVLAVLESNESLAEYKIKSLIDGTVIEKHFSLGEVVEGTDHGFVVADLSHVWIILNLYQKDLPYVKIGQKVKISAGKDMPETVAKISYISPVVDEETRTAAARVVINNYKGLWKPGLFVTGDISTSEKKVEVLVPKTALEMLEGKAVVFIKDEDGFEPREVTIGETNHESVEILKGLNAGEVYVSKNGFTLKSELQKGEMGEGHGH
jgi:membrane fusion protein, heavy metal efflux system